MRRRTFLLVFLAACASSQQSTGPNVDIALTQLTSTTDAFYFAGPVNLQYQLAVRNPTDQPVTLRRLDLETEGYGPYWLRTSGMINLRVAANSTATKTIYAWGQSRGGYLTSGEPVTIRLTGIFEDANGKSFSKLAIQNLRQP